MKKAQRRADARTLHVGCSAMDSIKATSIRHVLTDGELTDKEYEVIKKRYDRIHKDIATIRKVANIIERRSS